MKTTMTVKPSTTVDKSQQHIANHQLCSSKAEIGNNCDDGSNDVEHLDSRDGYDVDSELQQPVEKASFPQPSPVATAPRAIGISPGIVVRFATRCASRRMPSSDSADKSAR